MKTLLTANLSTKTATEGGNTWEPPQYVFGEAFVLSLRFVQSIDGSLVEPDLEIETVRAMIGYVDRRPESGQFALKIGAGPSTGSNTTDVVNYDAKAQEVADAINAKTAVTASYGNCSVTKADGTFKLRFGTGATEVPLQVVTNTLYPVSFGRVGAYQVDELWVHDLRLVQAPVALGETTERVLPPPPVVSLIAAGGSEGTVTWNELQSLYVPPDFRGTYVLKSGTLRTGELNVSDAAETIQAALEEVLGSGNVKVTNTEAFTARIEFIGDLEGEAQTLLVVETVSVPAGDITFTVELDKEELATVLRAQESVTLPLEVRIWVADQVQPIVAIRQDVTILRPVVWPELAETPAIDWLRPPSPRTYQAFNPDTVITGQQYFPAVVGDGVATEFVIDHGLATAVVFVWVRENISNGRILINGTDYEVRIVDDNSAEVTALGDAPDTDGWLVVVGSAQTVAAFADGLTIDIAQVTGLSAALEALEARIEVLEEFVPDNPPSLTDEESDGTTEIPLAAKTEVYPGRLGVGLTFAQASTSGRAVSLFPAVHDAAATNAILPLPAASSHEGSVFLNNTGNEIILPQAFGLPAKRVAANGYYASDGRGWARVSRSGTSTSYYPTDYERELWMLALNGSLLRAGQVLTVTYTLSLALLRTAARGNIMHVIELGTPTQDTTPATTAPNLANITWSDTPILSQSLLLTDVAMPLKFGASIVRDDAGDFSSNALLYGEWEASDEIPAGTDFVLRSRLINFDTENSENIKGLIFYEMTAPKAIITTP